MTGAKSLSCNNCEGFLEPVYVREIFDKYEKHWECKCGFERNLVMDGDQYTLTEKQDGVVTNTVRKRGKT